MKKIEFRLEAELHEALVARARKEGTTKSAIVREAIRDGLTKSGALERPT